MGNAQIGRGRWAAATAVIFVTLFGQVTAIHSATFNCTAGDVACLTAAIATANGNGDSNTINLAAGNYVLTTMNNSSDGLNGLPSITGNLTIAGAGSQFTNIGRTGTAFGDFSVNEYRIFHVASTGNLTLRGVTLYNGGGLNYYAGDGGALFNRGTVNLIDSAVTDSHTRTGNGAGITNNGTMTLTTSVVTGNSSAGSGGAGGGIYNTGTLTVTNSVVSSNFTAGVGFPVHAGSGGGIANVNGSVTMTGSSVVSNSSSQDSSGGGIASFSGTVTISRSSISRNFGGDLGGGGISSSGGTVTISNSTLGRNFSTTTGGALRNEGATASLQSTTISDNTAVLNGAGTHGVSGSLSLQNTILAQNKILGGGFWDCSGTATSGDNNLIGTVAGCTITLHSHDLTGDAGLAAYAENGSPGNGDFQLLATSQAIDSGNSAMCQTTDQLGNSRVGRCDIGAIEFQSPTLIVQIDVQPGSNPAPIVIKKQGVVPVAIMTTSAFDATAVDAATVRFGKTGAEAAPAQAVIKDVDGNGTLDLLLFFAAQSTGVNCGDTLAWLSGRTFDKTAIQGSDTIMVNGCKK